MAKIRRTKALQAFEASIDDILDRLTELESPRYCGRYEIDEVWITATKAKRVLFCTEQFKQSDGFARRDFYVYEDDIGTVAHVTDDSYFPKAVLDYFDLWNS